MKRDLLLSGIIGLLIGASVYLGASALSTRVPILLQGAILVSGTFALLLLLALAEIPMMLFGLRQMARSVSTPRRLVVAAFAVYVAFASVYASVFVLLTGQMVLGLVIAVVCVMRLASGMGMK